MKITAPDFGGFVLRECLYFYGLQTANCKRTMAKNDEIVSKILSELAKGGYRTSIMATIGNSWQISVRTFDRLWKKANEMHKEGQKSIQSKIVEGLPSEIIIGLKGAIKSDLELEAILCQIAGGNVQVEDWVKGEVVLRDVTPGEITQATAQIFKKRGSYAAIKQDITVRKVGKDLSEEETYE